MNTFDWRTYVDADAQPPRLKSQPDIAVHQVAAMAKGAAPQEVAKKLLITDDEVRACVEAHREAEKSV